MEQNLANGNKLKKVKDEAAIIGLISSAKNDDAEIYVWRLIGNSKLLARVHIESVRKFRKEYCLVPADGQEHQVQEMMASQTFIDLYIPGSALLLRSTIKQTDAPFRYYLQIPDFVAQVDRREGSRVKVHDTSEVQLSFGKTVLIPRQMTQHFLKSCYDISTGGFSFFVSKSEAKFFNVGEPIQKVELKSKDWNSKLNAEITSMKEVEPDEHNGLIYKVWRVSCRFTEIDQITKKYLEKFIFERIKDELHAINE